MKPILRRLTAILRPAVSLCILLLIPPVAAQQRLPSPWTPGPLELAKLPAYCIAQFHPDRKPAGARSPVEMCGVYMNHLCPGLVQINRAANTAYDRSTRKQSLEQARVEINYTLARVKPDCSIAQDVYAAEGRLKALQYVVK